MLGSALPPCLALVEHPRLISPSPLLPSTPRRLLRGLQQPQGGARQPALRGLLCRHGVHGGQQRQPRAGGGGGAAERRGGGRRGGRPPGSRPLHHVQRGAPGWAAPALVNTVCAAPPALLLAAPPPSPPPPTPPIPPYPMALILSLYAGAGPVFSCQASLATPPPTPSPPQPNPSFPTPPPLLQISGSVQLDSTAPQMLLAAGGPGLKHYRVPQHIHWPDALGHAAVCVFVTPDALQASARPARRARGCTCGRGGRLERTWPAVGKRSPWCTQPGHARTWVRAAGMVAVHAARARVDGRMPRRALPACRTCNARASSSWRPCRGSAWRAWPA